MRCLAGEVGIRRFLDIDTRLPTTDNTHEVAQAFAPDSWIIHVDNDPLVLTPARASSRDAEEGVTEYLHAELREPERILERSAEVLDLARPVALMLMGILGHVADHDEARESVRRPMASLPSGSFLTATTTPTCTARPTWKRTNSTTRAGECPTSSVHRRRSRPASNTWISWNRGFGGPVAL